MGFNNVRPLRLQVERIVRNLNISWLTAPTLQLFLMKKPAFTAENIMSTQRLLPNGRLFPPHQSLQQQNALCSQLLYWRSFDQARFTSLTRFNMNPVYHPCELTYAEAFFTFSAITDFCSKLSKDIVLAYLLCMFPDANEVTLAKQIHPQTARFNYHCLMRFNSYNVMDARYNVKFDKRFFPNWLLQPVYSYDICRNCIMKDADVIEWDNKSPKPVYPTKLIKQLLSEPKLPCQSLAINHEALVSTELTIEDILYHEAKHGTPQSLLEAFRYIAECYDYKITNFNALRTIYSTRFQQ